MGVIGRRGIGCLAATAALVWGVAPAQARFLQTDPVGYEDQINLYAYVGNDPINAIDPSGERIVVVAHEVKILGVATGQYHLKVAIIPNNQSAYRDDNRFITNDAGARVATLGAGPENSRLSNVQGDLVSNVNRPTDISERGVLVADILPGAGDTEDALIGRLFDADANYGDGLGYKFSPSATEGYNSNSYVSGLMKAVGVDDPPVPNQNQTPTPGADKPVPTECFRDGKGC